MKQYRILLAAAYCALISSVASAQTVGAIDTSFGTINTWATFNPSVHAVVRGGVSDLIELPDGKILGAGGCLEPVTNAEVTCLYRWTANGGAPDTSFGAGGVSYVMGGDDVGAKVRVVRRSDGRLLVAGSCVAPSTLRICIAVVNENGNGFDTSYGINGKSVVPPPVGYQYVRLSDLVFRADGSVLVAGTCQVMAFNTDSSFCVARIQANGSFDPTFGTNNWSVTTPSGGNMLEKITALPDGRYIVTGTCFTPTSRVCTLRYFSDGTLQVAQSFDVGTNEGKSVYDVRVFGSKVLISGSSYNLVAGRIYSSRRDAYTSAGNGDPTYGGTYPTGGMVSNLNIDLSNDGDAYRGKILRDGSVVFLGVCNPSPSRISCSARLNPQGLLDSSYGVNGRYEYASMPTPFGGDFSSNDLVEGASGDVYRPGYCVDGTTARPCVQRILMGTQPARVCTMDIDGDGLVKPTTDGLILARVSLGLKGSAALAGALGAGASRTTWGQVLDYLVDQCGMNLLP